MAGGWLITGKGGRRGGREEKILTCGGGGDLGAAFGRELDRGQRVGLSSNGCSASATSDAGPEKGGGGRHFVGLINECDESE